MYTKLCVGYKYHYQQVNGSGMHCILNWVLDINIKINWFWLTARKLYEYGNVLKSQSLFPPFSFLSLPWEVSKVFVFPIKDQLPFSDLSYLGLVYGYIYAMFLFLSRFSVFATFLCTNPSWNGMRCPIIPTHAFNGFWYI